MKQKLGGVGDSHVSAVKNNIKKNRVDSPLSLVNPSFIKL